MKHHDDRLPVRLERDLVNYLKRLTKKYDSCIESMAEWERRKTEPDFRIEKDDTKVPEDTEWIDDLISKESDKAVELHSDMFDVKKALEIVQKRMKRPAED